MGDGKLPAFIVVPLVLLLLGFAGGLLPAMFVALFFGSVAGWDVLLLVTILLALWFPMKGLSERLLRGTSAVFAALPKAVSPSALVMVFFASIVMVPFLWMVAGQAVALALLVYALSRTLWISLIAGLLVLAFSVYQSTRREKDLGSSGTFVMRMENFGSGSIFMSNLRQPEATRDQTPLRLRDESETVIDFEDDEPEPDYRRGSSAPDVITIDPNRSDDEPE